MQAAHRGAGIVTLSSERLLRLALSASMLSVPAAALAAHTQAPGPAHTQATTPADPEADEGHPAAVLLGGEPVIWITAGAGPYAPQFRAERISQRLEEIVHDRSLRDVTVTVTDVEGSSELRVGPRLLMVVTARDAASVGGARTTLAAQFAHDLENAIRQDRLRYAPATLVRSAIYATLATLVFLAALWVVRRVTGMLRAIVARGVAARGAKLRVMSRELLSPGTMARTARVAIRLFRGAVSLILFQVYLTYVLALFPWTRAVSVQLVGYLLTPVRVVGGAFLGYLPKLLFVIVICAVIYVAIRLVGLFFREIQQGRIVFSSFPSEWADPTNKIARVLLIAFGLVVAFPYLPASDSPAFAGVSVFMGVLVSLASSSALSNMIAGLVLTYTRAFRLGDRIQLGEAFGDVVETSLLATHIRTIKNEEVTIPNSIALGTAVTNYTRTGANRGLILHTTVTIGYDTPWRKVHELLTEAALATPGVLQEPRPFVWQTALNDFYVTYEVNAYTATPRQMVDIYAALHARIQDTFYAEGVEIMSPHYTAIRDGNTTAIPEASRGPGYEAPAFRIEEKRTQTNASGRHVGIPRRG
jgi:small-conductance mechanosensitive channel